MKLSIEEADAIFGRPMGIPKTGVFGLYDLIGIDLMADVLKSFVKELPENDDFQVVAKEIPLIKKLIDHSYREGSDLILSRNNPYINTIKPEEEIKSPGDQN